MSLRTLLKVESHYLVRYLIDNKFQIRTRRFIQADEEDEVKISALYEVQWGRSNQVATAVIVGAGTEDEMKMLLREKEEVSDPTPESPPSPAPKRKKQENTEPKAKNPPLKLVKKKPAAIIKRTAQPVTTDGNKEHNGCEIPETRLEPQSPTITEHSSRIGSQAELREQLPLSNTTDRPSVHTANCQPDLQPSLREQQPLQYQPAHSKQYQPDTQPFGIIPQCNNQQQFRQHQRQDYKDQHYPLSNRTLHQEQFNGEPLGQSQQNRHLMPGYPQSAYSYPDSVQFFQTSKSPPLLPLYAAEPITPTTPSTGLFDLTEGTLTELCSTPTIKRPCNDKRFEVIYRRLTGLEKSQMEIKNSQNEIKTMLNNIITILSSNANQPMNQPINQMMHQPMNQPTRPTHPTDGAYPFSDLPEQYRIGMADLEFTLHHTTNAGQFAAEIVKKLYPELFGTDAARLKYSYHGGGKLEKTELDSHRKKCLQRYVLYYYPTVSDPRAWKDIVIARVNELLRRPVRL